MLLLLLPLLLLLVSSTGLSQPAPPGPTRPPGPVGPPSFGLNTHLATRYPDPASMHEAAAIVEELGVSWVREDLHWHRVQRLPDAWDWTFTDAALRELLNRDIQVVGVLGPSVGWATPYPGDTRTDVSFHPPDPAAFAAYAGAVVRRYRRYIKHWEVWNEPDNQLFWQPQPDPLAYADLLMRTSEAIKAADPDARVLIGGVNPFDSTFLRKVAEVGAWQSFDILAIHPYIDPYTPEEGNIVASLDKMHALTSQYGAKPIWATEIGWASGPGDRDALGKTDAANQANFLVRSLLLLWQAGVERSFWYMLKDDAHNPYGLVEYGRGRTDFREELRKPAFYALRTLNRELRDVQFVERRDLFDSTIAINFSKAGAWQRANQPNGQLDSSTVGVGRIRYNFSTAGNDYVVFERVQPVPLAGEPYALGVWIYGDGTDHALKAWLRDAEGEVLQFRLGIVGAPGWHFVSTPLRVPVTGGDIIAGQGNQRLDFPATLTALVLDDGYDAYVGTSTIYLDDVTAIYGREVYNLRFKQVQGGGALDVIWSPPGLRITLNTRALNGSLVTLRGEAQNIAAAGGRFALNVGGEPIFLWHVRE